VTGADGPGFRFLAVVGAASSAVSSPDADRFLPGAAAGARAARPASTMAPRSADRGAAGLVGVA